MPATTLQALAKHSDGPPDLKKASKSKKNSFRNINRLIKRWGLRWNIPESVYWHSDEHQVHYLAPHDIFSYLLKNAPELLFGGISDFEVAKRHLQCFWDCYKKDHATHEVYKHEQLGTLSLNQTIPILCHGDEGRGVRKGNTTVVSVESVFGLDSYTSDCYNSMPCCSGTDEALLCDFQNINLRFHSFLTKYLVFALPGKVYKGTKVLEGLLRVIFQDLRACFYEGIKIGNQYWNFACIGLKGDLQWHLKVGALERSFARLSWKTDKMCCHECLAGSSQRPFEDLSAQPCWADSLWAERPWSAPPESGMILVPYDTTKPEAVMKRDMFHNLKVGVLQDFIGSSVMILAEWRYFDVPGESNSRSKQLERMFGHFRLFCSSKGRSPNLHGFTKNFFNAPTRRHYPWSKSKGSDSVLLVQWLMVLSVGCQQDIRNPKHRNVLHGMHVAAKSADKWLKAMYAHGLWWKPACAADMLKLGETFLKCYAFLSWVCLHEHKFLGYALKCKSHMLAHTVLDLRNSLATGASRIPSCLIHGCEMNEDFIGRIARLSRKLHQSQICRRVLNMYLIKAHALRTSYLRTRSCNKKRKIQ